jgi:hypothetical protein
MGAPAPPPCERAAEDSPERGLFDPDEQAQARTLRASARRRYSDRLGEIALRTPSGL